jgi:hypothetical protein
MWLSIISTTKLPFPKIGVPQIIQVKRPWLSIATYGFWMCLGGIPSHFKKFPISRIGFLDAMLRAAQERSNVCLESAILNFCDFAQLKSNKCDVKSAWNRKE